MPTTTTLSKPQFDRELDRLTHLKEQVGKVLRPAVDAYLAFAKGYWTLYQTVEDDPRRVATLRARLGITEDYQHQRLRRIAEQSDTLRPFKNALPAAVEPLYEAALVAAKNPKRLKELTAESGIREIRDLKKPKGASSGHTKPRRPAATGSVTLALSRYDEARLANVLAMLLEDDPKARIQSDSQSLVDATKKAVVDRYEQRATGRGGTIPRVPDVSWSVQAACEQLEKGTKPSGTKTDDVVKNDKHPYHSDTIPNPELAAKLKAHAEEQRWLVPEMGLPYEHYAPEVKQRQERISKR
jgi:hypothetical protein